MNRTFKVRVSSNYPQDGVQVVYVQEKAFFAEVEAGHNYQSTVKGEENVYYSTPKAEGDNVVFKMEVLEIK